MQSKLNSFVETMFNVLIGFFTTLLISPFIYYVCDVQMSNIKMTYVTLLFTIVSIIRGYIIRRWFNSNGKRKRSKSYGIKLDPPLWEIYLINGYMFASPSEFILKENLFKLKNNDIFHFDDLEPSVLPLNAYIKPSENQIIANLPILVA